MQYRCTRCSTLIATISGSNVTICGDATIAGSFPPSNPHSDWIKCSKCNAWARAGSASDLSRQLEEQRRQRVAQAEANRRRLEAERQRREAERQRQEQQRRQQAIDNYRNEFNGYSSNANDLRRQISSKQQEQQREEKVEADLTRQRNDERTLLSKFSQERSDMNLARIVLIGETGVGKSTLANRLIGDGSPYCDSSGAVFRVGNGIRSKTTAIQKEIRNVRLASGAYKMISVIDTPGLSDSENRDRHHANSLCEYLRGVERVHLFVIVLSLANPRLDDATLQGLEQMTTMFGRNFWRFVTIVYTSMDDARKRAEFPRNVAELQARIRGHFGVGEREAPLNVIGIGFDDWQAGVMQVIESANASKYYTCGSLQSPLQQLENNLAQQTRKVQSVRNEVANLNSRLSTVQANMERARSSLRGYGVYV